MYIPLMQKSFIYAMGYHVVFCEIIAEGFKDNSFELSKIECWRFWYSQHKFNLVIDTIR